SIRTDLARAVNSGIHKVNGNAFVVYQIALGGATFGVGSLPGAISISIGQSLQSPQFFWSANFTGWRAQFRGSHWHIDRVGVVKEQEHETKRERGSERAKQDRDLLKFRGRSNQKARFQILGRRAAVGRGNKDNAADRERSHKIIRSGPADDEKRQTGEQQRRHRHS